MPIDPSVRWGRPLPQIQGLLPLPAPCGVRSGRAGQGDALTPLHMSPVFYNKAQAHEEALRKVKYVRICVDL